MKWILCKNKLPSHNQRVLVTVCTEEKGRNVRSGTFYDHYFMNDNGDVWNACEDTEVVAWMPLPKPYEA